MGITFPEVPDAQDVLAPDDVGGPQQAAKHDLDVIHSFTYLLLWSF